MGPGFNAIKPFMPLINKVLYSRVGSPTNIRLSQGQTLAYYEHSEIMAVIFYVILGPEVCAIQLFTMVIKTAVLQSSVLVAAC